MPAVISFSGRTARGTAACVAPTAEGTPVTAPAAGCHDTVDIQLDPTDLGKRHFALVEVRPGARGLIAHQPGSVGQFDDGPHLVEPGRARDPANFRAAGQIDVVALLAKSGCYR